MMIYGSQSNKYWKPDRWQGKDEWIMMAITRVEEEGGLSFIDLHLKVHPRIIKVSQAVLLFRAHEQILDKQKL